MRGWFSKIGVGSALALVGIGAIAVGALGLALGGGGGSATADQVQAAQNDDSGRDGDHRGARDHVMPAPVPGGPGFGPPSMHLRVAPPSAAERTKHRREHRERRDRFHRDLAEELGKSPEEIEAAFEAVFKKQIERDVKAGKLTRQQAGEILKCHENESCGPPGPPRR